MKTQKILYKGGEGELIEKKSRFIATTRPVESEEEALAFIAEMNCIIFEYRYQSNHHKHIDNIPYGNFHCCPIGNRN